MAPWWPKMALQNAKNWLTSRPWSKECMVLIWKKDQLKTLELTVHTRNKWFDSLVTTNGTAVVLLWQMQCFPNFCLGIQLAMCHTVISQNGQILTISDLYISLHFYKKIFLGLNLWFPDELLTLCSINISPKCMKRLQS